jgi:hypothetical protein
MVSAQRIGVRAGKRQGGSRPSRRADAVQFLRCRSRVRSGRSLSSAVDQPDHRFHQTHSVTPGTEVSESLAAAILISYQAGMRDRQLLVWGPQATRNQPSPRCRRPSEQGRELSRCPDEVPNLFPAVLRLPSLAPVNVPAMSRSARCSSLGPCIRQTRLPFTAGARQVRPLRLLLAVQRGAAWALCMGLLAIFFASPIPPPM